MSTEYIVFRLIEINPWLAKVFIRLIDAESCPPNRSPLWKAFLEQRFCYDKIYVKNETKKRKKMYHNQVIGKGKYAVNLK